MKINEEQKYPCRSNWGYEFCDGISLELHHQTLMAAKKIGLEVGAADVLYYKGQWLFLELNSAASVDHRIVREFYQAALAELIKKKEQEQSNAIQNEQQTESAPAQASPPVVAESIQPVNVPPVAEPLPIPAVDQPVGQPARADGALPRDAAVESDTIGSVGLAETPPPTTNESVFEFTLNPIEPAMVPA